MNLRVLVVDDSAMMRKIMNRSLVAAGASDIIEAADGNEALELFEPGRFDVVVTDWNMPGRNGLEVVREIRMRDESIPIILVTTEHERLRVAQALEAGVSECLVKPFTAQVLREKLLKYGCAAV